MSKPMTLQEYYEVYEAIQQIRAQFQLRPGTNTPGMMSTFDAQFRVWREEYERQAEAAKAVQRG